MALTLSVVIATKDREQALAECLESVKLQSEPPEAIIIIDASDGEKTASAVHGILENSAIELIYKKSKPGLTYQRNLGIKNNKNDLLLFLDDDVVLDPHYIEEVKRIFCDDKTEVIGGVTGRIEPGKPKSFVSIFIRKLFCLAEPAKGEVKKSFANNSIHPRYTDKAFEVDWLSGCNQCYRKKVFDEFLFDENLASYAYMEDVDFSYRVSKKYKLMFTPRARLVHNVQVSNATRLKKREKQRMFMINLRYLFGKNLPQTFVFKFCHYWSYIGYLLRGLLLERNLDFTIGTLQGIWINISGRNPLINKLKKDKK